MALNFVASNQVKWMPGEELPRVCSYRYLELLILHVMEQGMCMLRRLLIVAGKAITL